MATVLGIEHHQHSMHFDSAPSGVLQKSVSTSRVTLRFASDHFLSSGVCGIPNYCSQVAACPTQPLMLGHTAQETHRRRQGSALSLSETADS